MLYWLKIVAYTKSIFSKAIFFTNYIIDIILTFYFCSTTGFLYNSFYIYAVFGIAYFFLLWYTSEDFK